jgi:hypothetical protein
VQSATSFVYYLASPRDGGGFYVLATMAATKSPAETTDQTARDIDQAIRMALHQITSP